MSLADAALDIAMGAGADGLLDGAHGAVRYRRGSVGTPLASIGKLDGWAGPQKRDPYKLLAAGQEK